MKALPVALAFALTVFPGLLMRDQPAPAAMTQAGSDAAIDAQCRPYFHAACSEAMARWVNGFKVTPLSDKEARLDHQDAFAYGGRRRGPEDGTFFAYGTSSAGPSGHAVYDPVHRIAFFAQGAFDWNQVVLAAAATPPPRAVIQRDLAGVRTVRGAYLGETSAAVQTIYGMTVPVPATGHVGLSVLTYGREFTSAHVQCGQSEDFLLRNDRVVEIVLSSAC
jgi:hypothetical protein